MASPAKNEWTWVGDLNPRQQVYGTRGTAWLTHDDKLRLLPAGIEPASQAPEACVFPLDHGSMVIALEGLEPPSPGS